MRENKEGNALTSLSMSGGKQWFAVEAISFKIEVEESGSKLRGRILERGRGRPSWIRFGDVSLQLLLEVVEVVIKDAKKAGWPSA